MGKVTDTLQPPRGQTTVISEPLEKKGGTKLVKVGKSRVGGRWVPEEGTKQSKLTFAQKFPSRKEKKCYGTTHQTVRSVQK